MVNEKIEEKLKQIKFLITDVDGVLTDTGVYYSASGEELKRFSVRDGMGVERLRKLCDIETGIITGEKSFLLRKRADKLDIQDVYLGIKNKIKILEKICNINNLKFEEVAYIGDDVNDKGVIDVVGLTACPADAMKTIKNSVDIVLENKGGHGAFREFAEIIIEAKQKIKKED